MGDTATSFLLNFYHGGDLKFDGIPLADVVTVGRHTENTVVLPDDSVSRHHATFSVRGSRGAVRAVLTDDGSTNGCVVNGRTLKGAALEIKPGDAIQIGVFRVELVEFAEDLEDFSGRDEPGAQIVFEAPLSSDGALVDRRLRVLADISAELSRLEGAQLVEFVGKAIGRCLGFKVLYVLLQEGNRSVKHFAFTPEGRRSMSEVELSRTLIKKCLEDGNAILADNGPAGPPADAQQSFVCGSLRSAMCVPLLSQEHVYGVLYLSSPDNLSYKQDDLQLLVPIAGLLSSRLATARAFSEVQAAKEKLEAILASLTEGVLLTDGEFRVVTANETACKIFDGQDVVARSLQELLAGFQHNFLPQGLPAVTSFKLSRERADTEGSEVVYEATISQNAPAQSHGWKYVICLRDVTQRQQLETMSSRFIHRMAHKLTQPLTRATAANTLLAQEARKAAATSLMELAEESLSRTRECGSLVSQLMHYSSLGLTLGSSIRWARCPLEELVAAAVCSNADLIERKAFNVVKLFQPGTVEVLGDQEKLEVVFHHLVENAVEFGKSGGKLLVGVDSQAALLEITLLDDGPGIAPKELERFGELLKRGHATSPMEPEAGGFGLWLVHRVAQCHLGRVEVTSPANENEDGTLIRLVLPGSVKKTLPEPVC